jgi:hypothetical protein
MSEKRLLIVMGFLDMSPSNASMVKNAGVIAIVGFFFVIGLAYVFMSLQEMLTIGLVP